MTSINVTSLVDVMFCLLIAFMVAAAVATLAPTLTHFIQGSVCMLVAALTGKRV